MKTEIYWPTLQVDFQFFTPPVLQVGDTWIISKNALSGFQGYYELTQKPFLTA